MGKFVLIPESERVVWSVASFFFFSVLAPFACFAEIVEPSASFSVAVVMSPFVPHVLLPVLV